MAHEGNHICLYRFSFIYVMDDLWEDAYTCPVNIMNRTTESAIYVMELTVMGWVPVKSKVFTSSNWKFDIIYYNVNNAFS